MADVPKIYWDACIWIALIKREHGRFDSCRHILEQAQRGEVQIWTSAFTLVEVVKRNCAGEPASLEEASDHAFEDYIEQDFVYSVQVDRDVGTAARRLLRRYPSIRKPQDALHIATALLQNLDELHTFDSRDILKLDGQLTRLDGKKLKICFPPDPPDPLAGTLFEEPSAEDGSERRSG